MALTDEELNEIEERCTNATKGPWTSFIEGRDHESGDSFIMTGVDLNLNIWEDSRGEDLYISPFKYADQDFIAHAKQDIPKLLKELRQLRLEMKKRLPTPTIKIGREVFAASSSRFAVFCFGRKDAGIKALFS
jgi:hypothetical protein